MHVRVARDTLEFCEWRPEVNLQARNWADWDNQLNDKAYTMLEETNTEY